METKQQLFDPSQNFLERFPQRLDAMFNPKSVALIGAKDDIGSVARTIQVNLMTDDFENRIYPVNPKRDEVLGLKSYPSIKDVPEAVDLAVIVTPPKVVPAIIQQCVEAGTQTVVIITAGFKEHGPEGIALEEKIKEIVKGTGMRIVGPNCLGIMNPAKGLNATFAKGMALPGNLAFISQSGALCTAVLDWSLKEHVGFSAFVSVGSMIDVNWGDLIDYFGGDPSTRSILLYMETVGDPRSFLSAAREVALEKPIIVIKPGRTQAAAKAAASHTGSLVGSDAVFDAALERVGVLRVESIAELFNMAEVLAKQPEPKGPNLGIITNAGGPAVLATDAAILHGAKLPSITKETEERLSGFLPAAWSHNNPVDVLGDAGAEAYAKTLNILAEDPNMDGLLVILSPQDMTDPLGTAEAMRHLSISEEKPILASWMGAGAVHGGVDSLNQGGIPTFEYPDQAAWAFANMWRYHQNLQTLYETPTLDEDLSENGELTRKEEANKIAEVARKEGREILDEEESKRILALYEIPVVETLLAETSDEAVQLAEKIGYPVVLKIYSKTITHKTDVGGIQLNLSNAEAVKNAFSTIQSSVEAKVGKGHMQGVTVQKMISSEGYELILGSSIDPQFGPILLFGSGGQLVEVYQDTALALPPLGEISARHLMKKTKVYEALKGVRGKKAINMKQLEKILIDFSQLVVENDWISECDINPLKVSENGMIALDARIVLQSQEENPPPPAIRPYPSEYRVDWQLKNGKDVVIRPIKPRDEAAVTEFHQNLSENSVRQRYFAFISLSDRVSHERLIRICFNDFDREIAIVAKDRDSDQIFGVGRLSKLQDRTKANMALIVDDRYHDQGLGTKLVEQMIHIAKEENLQEVYAKILSENTGMISICKKLGFEVKPSTNGNYMFASLRV